MTRTNAEKFADDCIALEKALGTLTDAQRAKLKPILLAPPARLRDCALDYIIEGEPVHDRVLTQRAALAGGYVRPWNRDRGPEK